MRKLRGNLTYANVMSTLCLFLLLGGGTAFAATKLGKNSVGTKQLKNGAVTAAKVKSGSLLASNFAAGQLPKGERGERGERGEPGPLVETLPSGKTETGIYGAAGTRASGGMAYTPGTAVSFPIPLAIRPTLNVIKKGAPSTAQCPGSVKAPRATAGNLCIYESREDVPLEIQPVEEDEMHSGFMAFYEGAEGANYQDDGVWAVTAN
jgi:hypothetical protein